MRKTHTETIEIGAYDYTRQQRKRAKKQKSMLLTHL